MRNCCLPVLFFLLLPAIGATATPPEDWTSPKVDRKILTAAKPVVGERDQYATFTRELVRVQWRAADPIYLYILIPKLVRNPPAILYLYNYDTDCDRFLNDKFGALLTAKGVAAVGFSSALSGQRYHDRPMKQWFVSELQESLGSSAHDVQMILDYLATRGDMDASRVGMFGEGSGATIAVLAAAADPRIKVLDLLNPWGDWPDWVRRTKTIPEEERPDFDTKTFVDSVAGLDPLRYLPGLRIPIRVAYMGAEEAIPATVSDRLQAAAPPQALIVPSEKALADYKATAGQTFLNWMKDQLQGVASAPGVPIP